MNGAQGARVVLIGIALALLAPSRTSLLAAAEPTPTLEQAAAEYASTAKPLLKRYCLGCHSTDAMEGELDLERFAALGDVRKEPGVWQRVAEMLDNGEMPPKDARRLPDEKRRALRGWLAGYLRAEALAGAGDPGPVVLRRLSNAQYTYTLRDLTGVPLDPAREFPVDGAAGEGFTNTGNALVMSPALLTKYLDAAKEVAAHAVPLPDGMRFSPGTTRRDWTDEALERIRDFYAGFTDSGGGTRVNLQGIVFGTNAGGRLPLEHYLAATLAERDALAGGAKSIDAVARDRKLSPKYLGLLWNTLNDPAPSPLLDAVRSRWRTAQPAEAAAIAAEIMRWQSGLWKFNSVGHIGKIGGPKSWMEPVSPLLARQEFRMPVPAATDGHDVTLYLAADDAGDGDERDVVVWERPRVVAPGMPDLLLRNLPAVARALAVQRGRVFAGAERSLAAAAEASATPGGFDPALLAEKHGVPQDVLAAWFAYLGLGDGTGAVTITSHLRGKHEKGAGYDFVNGWGPGATPNMVANSSDMHVRVPGNLKPHSIAMHPAPTLRVAAGWLSPVSAALKIEGKVQHAHPECGNGVTWSLEVRRGETRQRLAVGVAQGPNVVPVGPFEPVPVRPGDLVSIVIGPRDGNHACDLTAVDLSLVGDGKTWDLAGDVSPDVLAGNPHADRLGNPAVWHFYTEPERGGDPDSAIPQGSLLASWQSATIPDEKQRLARDIQALLTSGVPAVKDSPDARLYRQLASLRGPLLRGILAEMDPAEAEAPAELGPATFGLLPGGAAIDPASLGVRAPSVVEVTLPADLVEGCEFVTSGVPHPAGGAEASVQLQVSATRPGDGPRPDPSRPVVVAEGSPARRRFEAAFDTFRQMFPPALCYTKIVPVDEVVTLTLFYREDDLLRRLMLDDAQAAHLDRLWDELRFVSQDALTLVDAFQQLLEYASQDGDPKLFEPLRQPIQERADAFRRTLVESEPKQVDAVLEFAARAYRRPLTESETTQLRDLYRKLRGEELSHDDAWRLLLARVLVAPAFLYRVETAAPGTSPVPLDDWDLANRLSYFLWSSVPDGPLRELAAAGRLGDPDVLAAQAGRMLKDEKVRRLASEFACQWLQVYVFDTLDEKSDRHFPSFRELRGAMHEETIRFFTDLFQRDLPVLAFLDADHAMLNEALARHYGIPGVSGENWRRVEGVKPFGRGGILGLSAPLTQQSGASRTSPILRGIWVSEVLLGEKLPKPPPGVPQLPDDESSAGELTVRQLVEKHSRDPACATCHAKIDPLGFALEGFDAIGRRRVKDLGDHPVEVTAKLQDGTTFEGIEGLRSYLLTRRRDAVARQFSRKLLGYALGRGVQLSDDPLLDEMTRIVSDGGRYGAVVEAIVRSRQFREIRGRDTVVAEAP
jgi:mono/diheme cytochrome c family protein